MERKRFSGVLNYIFLSELSFGFYNRNLFSFPSERGAIEDISEIIIILIESVSA